MRIFLGFGMVCAAGLLAFSYAGAWHPAGDSFAVIRWPLALGFAVLVWALPLARMLRGALCLMGLAMAGAVLAPSILRQTASDYDFVLYQQNLLFSRTERAEWLAAVAASDADVVTLQEVSGANRVVLDALKESHPTQVYCEFASVGGVAVLSRFEAVQGSQICADRNGLAAVQVETPYGRTWLVSVHLHWPWPYGQSAQVDRLIPVLEGLDGHVIMAGDFNAVAWSYVVRRLARASGTRLEGPHRATFSVKGYPLSIDHVLTSAAYAQEVRVVPRRGSDHHGVVAYLTRPNPP